MRLMNLDAKIIVPITDDTKGGMVYEAQMTAAEFFAKFLPDSLPEIVEAIPIKWLNERHRKCCEDGDTDLMDAITVLISEYRVWRDGQEV